MSLQAAVAATCLLSVEVVVVVVGSFNADVSAEALAGTEVPYGGGGEVWRGRWGGGGDLFVTLNTVTT